MVATTMAAYEEGRHLLNKKGFENLIDLFFLI